ncbi:MAG: hypothetical protein ABIQ97_01015, partial [Lysobacteraceae bacterium]
MNIIIVAKFLKSPKRFCVHDDRKLALGALGALSALMLAGFVGGFFTRGGVALAEVHTLRGQLHQQQAQLSESLAASQREVNALAARLGQLQAQANRLNALGERLTRMGKLEGGEFNFNTQPGTGGAEQSEAISATELDHQISLLDRTFSSSGEQLRVLESLLVDQSLDRSQTPSAMPLVKTYVSA